MDFSEILRVCRAWHKLQVIQYWGNPVGILDSGSLWNFRYHCVKGGIREPLAKQRWWRHLANSIALAEVPASYDCFLVLKINCFTLHIVNIFMAGHIHLRWVAGNTVRSHMTGGFHIKSYLF